MPVKTLTLLPNRNLSFKGPIETNLVSYATLINDTDKVFAFKVNLPKEKLSASPSSGMIGPNKTIAVKVTLGALKPGERRRPHTIQFQTVEQSTEDVKLYDLVASRIDPEKVTTYELSVSYVDENGNKDVGTGNVSSMSKDTPDFGRNSTPTTSDGKEDSTVDSDIANSSDFDESPVRDEHLSSAKDEKELVGVNETADHGDDDGKLSAGLKKDTKPSPASRIPKFVGLEHYLQSESPPPGFHSTIVAKPLREIDPLNRVKLLASSTPKPSVHQELDHAESAVSSTSGSFKPTIVKTKDDVTWKASEPVVTITDPKTETEKPRVDELKDKFEDRICAGVYGAIAKQSLQKRLGRTKSLDQALNDVKLIRTSRFRDCDDNWRNPNNDETPSIVNLSQNASEQGLADSSQTTKGCELTRILEDLHLNAEQQKVQAQKADLNCEDPAAVERDWSSVSEDYPKGSNQWLTANSQILMTDVPDMASTLQEPGGAARNGSLDRDLVPGRELGSSDGRGTDPQLKADEAYMRMRENVDEVWREAIFYAVGFLILGMLLGKLGL